MCSAKAQTIGCGGQIFCRGLSLITRANAQTISSPCGSSFVGPGDLVGGAKAWYGLRGYKLGYTGKAVNICTPSDAACEDESIAANGLLTLGITGQTCNNTSNKCTGQEHSTIRPGNGNTLTQTTIADRYTFIAPGASNGCTLNSAVCYNSAGGAMGYTIAGFNGAADIAQPYTVNAFINFGTPGATAFNGFDSINSGA